MASQQPPVRPWFRLGSIGRPAPAPAPAPPAPEPTRPPMARPAFLPIAQPQAPAPPQEAVVAPPPPPPLLAPSVSSVPAVAALPTSPVKIIPTATAASPKPKPTAPPPSPLILPPAKLKSQVESEPKIPVEAEQKTVLVQKTIEKPKGWSNGDSHKDITVPNGNQESYKGGEAKDNGYRKKLTSDSDKRSLITITGENRGAVMELTHSPRKHGFEGKPHHLRMKGNSTNEGEELHNYSSSSSSEAEDGKHKMKDKELKSKAEPMNAYVNSNVQGVNSSLVYNSTCDLHDPGVHLTLPRKLTGGEGCDVGGNGYNS